MRTWVIVAAVLAGGAARADQFGDLAQRALPVDDRAAVGALFWAQSVDCTKGEDDLLRRQCEGVRQARAGAAAGQTYRVRGDASAFVAGDWDDAKKGVPVSVRGCLACREPLDVGGQKKYLVTRGALSVQGGAVVGPELGKSLYKLPGEEPARVWKAAAAPRVRVELVVKVPDKTSAWTQGAAGGYSVELLGYRAYDPCDGKVILSSPPSESAPADEKACGAQAKVVAPAAVAQAAAPRSALPKAPSPDDIKKAMTVPASEAQSCFAALGVPGLADLFIEVDGKDGHVRDVEVKGDFKGTATAECVVTAVKKTKFPPFARDSMIIHYPIQLR